MTFGIVGLGRMGLSLGQMAVERGHEVVAWDPDASTRDTASQAGLHTVDELTDVPGALSSPRVLLMWVPHGTPVDDNLEQLLPRLVETPTRCRGT
jgi:6-phosphogluconate dehydrogenase